MPAIDDAGALKDFGEAADWIVGRIQDGPILLHWFVPKVMIEARVGGSDVPKIAPPGWMMPATKVNPPNH